MSGCFVTFEGLDGSGKSTHLRAATRWLEEAGIELEVTREPGGTPIGRAIRQVFLDTQWEDLDGIVEALLIFASRREHLHRVIEPALAAGRHVLCDRFTDSTLAYQGFGRGVDAAALDALDRLATGRRRPDRTLLFDLPAGLARERGHSTKRQAKPLGVDRLDREDLAFYERVRAGYLELAQREPERFRVIDSSGARAATESQVRAALADLEAGGG